MLDCDVIPRSDDDAVARAELDSITHARDQVDAALESR